MTIHKGQLLSFKYRGVRYSRLPETDRWLRQFGRHVDFRTITGNHPIDIINGFEGGVL